MFQDDRGILVADQDSVRLLAVEGCAALGKLLEPADCVANVLPVIVSFSQVGDSQFFLEIVFLLITSFYQVVPFYHSYMAWYWKTGHLHCILRKALNNVVRESGITLPLYQCFVSAETLCRECFCCIRDESLDSSIPMSINFSFPE